MSPLSPPFPTPLNSLKMSHEVHYFTACRVTASFVAALSDELVASWKDSANTPAVHQYDERLLVAVTKPHRPTTTCRRSHTAPVAWVACIHAPNYALYLVLTDTVTVTTHFPCRWSVTHNAAWQLTNRQRLRGRGRHASRRMLERSEIQWTTLLGLKIRWTTLFGSRASTSDATVDPRLRYSSRSPAAAPSRSDSPWSVPQTCWTPSTPTMWRTCKGNQTAGGQARWAVEDVRWRRRLRRLRRC